MKHICRRWCWPMFCALFALGCVLHSTRAHEPKPIYNSQKETAKPLSPSEALAALKLPDGFHATLFAAEPQVQQPISITTDARGRLWVAENYTYAEARLGFDDELKDRILILEDADLDGVAEKRTVFWDQGNRLTSVAVGFGGVWAMCPPKLLFIPDRNGDDTPDEKPIVMLDGFEIGASSHHNFANGLKRGPDGWLYGRVGIAAPARIGRPGTPSDQRVDVGASIWRFHPVTKQVEEVCTGGTNSWGHDWNADGELFFINTVIGHLWHAIPGAHFRRMYGADRNPHVYEIIEQTADHFHWDVAESWGDAKKGVTSSTDAAGGGHAHTGMIIYDGDNWPASYRDKLFTVNMHGMRVNSDRIERAGATYVGKHDADFLKSDDPYFRGVELHTAADGSVFLADWSDIGECHENDGVHRTSGRIYKITYGNTKPQPLPDLAALDSSRLVEFQQQPNRWLAWQTRQILQERAATGEAMEEVHRQLWAAAQATDNENRQRINLLYCLHVTDGLTEEKLLELLQDKNEHIRSWGVQRLAERYTSAPSSATRDAFRELAKSDPSGLVLVHLASALQRLPFADRWPIAAQLAQHEELALDRVFPLMLWYGIEKAVPADPALAVEVASGAQIPLVRRFVARRLSFELSAQPASVEILVQAIRRQATPAQQRDLLEGMAAGLAGQRRADAPATWDALQKQIEASADEPLRQLAQRVSLIFGDGQAIGQLKQLVSNNSQDFAARQSALRSLVEAQADGLRPLLEKLLDDRDLAGDAASGLARFDDPAIASLIIKKYGRLRGAARDQAIGALVGRPRDALALLEAIERGQIERDQVALFYVRQMQGYGDERIATSLAKIWPDLRPIAAEKRARIAALKEALPAEVLAKADLAKGRKLWEATCVKCHTLHGTGAKTGPDLTGAQRHNLDYLLENIVDPSASLAPNFRMSAIAMNDGRVLQGVILQKSRQIWQIQTATELLTLNTDDIDEAKVTQLSLMPEGMLDVLAPEAVRDLIGYVMSDGKAARQ